MAVTDMTTGAPIGPKGVPTGDISDLGFRQDEGRIVFTTSPSTSRTDVFIADVDDLVEPARKVEPWRARFRGCFRLTEGFRRRALHGSA